MVKVTATEPSAKLAFAAAVAMTVHVPFWPTTTTLPARRWQKDVLGVPMLYEITPEPEVVASVDGVNSRPPSGDGVVVETAVTGLQVTV